VISLVPSSKNEEAKTSYKEAFLLYENTSDEQGKAHCTNGLGDLADEAKDKSKRDDPKGDEHRHIRR